MTLSTKCPFDQVTLSTKYPFDQVALWTKCPFDQVAFDQVSIRPSGIRPSGIRPSVHSTKWHSTKCPNTVVLINEKILIKITKDSFYCIDIDNENIPAFIINDDKSIIESIEINN
jgi:hypothetical protein